ncbi:hypothetical protein LY76DRAFT_114563 [Colletotrichum caudatum]|nr:hypothetical protein LY76DRAFT_114563 [Colletotrichum caudatum]
MPCPPSLHHTSLREGGQRNRQRTILLLAAILGHSRPAATARGWAQGPKATPSAQCRRAKGDPRPVKNEREGLADSADSRGRRMGAWPTMRREMSSATRIIGTRMRHLGSCSASGFRGWSFPSWSIRLVD